jgi:hypothetical protein
MQPPDVTHLPRKEGLEVLRSYRKQREAAKEFDFSQGPPNVTELEGPERLAVLRKYRQWLQAQDEAFEASPLAQKPAGTTNIKRDDYSQTPRERPAASVAPWLKEQSPVVPPLDIGDYVAPPDTAAKSAGLTSGAHGSMYSYFERPITARERTNRVPPTAESEPVDAPSPRAAQLAEAALREQALEGAAGVQSTAGGSTAWLGAWLENETPRNCRKLLPKDGAFEETKTHIFAPQSQPDEAAGAAAKSKIEQMRAHRQRLEAEALAAKIAAIESAGPVAGVATALAPPASQVIEQSGAAGEVPTPSVGGLQGQYMTEYAAASIEATTGEPAYPPPTPRSAAAEMPSTVGMSRAAVMEVKKQWRLALKGEDAAPTPRGGAGVVAGMASEYRAHTVRGNVPQLDASSAADYNLQVKLAKGSGADSDRFCSTPRAQEQSAPAPWLDGGEKMVFPAPAAAPPLLDISDDGGASARLSSAPFGTQQQPAGMATPRGNLDGLSHAEKLQRMREIRQASMAAPGTPRASTALA